MTTLVLFFTTAALFILSLVLDSVFLFIICLVMILPTFLSVFMLF